MLNSQHCVDPLDTPHWSCQIKLLSFHSDQQYRALTTVKYIFKHLQFFFVPDRHYNLLLSWFDFPGCIELYPDNMSISLDKTT